MTYKELVTSMNDAHYDKYGDKAIFIGYNVTKGSRMYGTLDNIPEDNCIEMPICENLMAGIAMGMAIEGYYPVVCFERHDFLPIALDSIVNHIDKWAYLTNNQVHLPIIIRAIVGSNYPLDVGIQHKQDYTTALRDMLEFTDVVTPFTKTAFDMAWRQIEPDTISYRQVDKKYPSGVVIIVEYKDKYNEEIL